MTSPPPAASPPPAPLTSTEWRTLERSAHDAVHVAQARLERLRADAAAAGTDLTTTPLPPIDPNDPPEPLFAPAVFLRSREVDRQYRHDVEEALWERGWHVIRQRRRAWQLARSSVPVAIVDLQPDAVIVGMLHARYEDGADTTDPQAAKLLRINGARYTPPANLDALAGLVHTALARDPRNTQHPETHDTERW